MAANYTVPEEELFSIFSELSDGVMIIDSDGGVVYRNDALGRLPDHLEERIVKFCGPQKCGCGQSEAERLAEQALMEGWNVSCHHIGANKILTVKFDDKLGERIRKLREEFGAKIAEGTPASLAAMHVLRNFIDNRWIAIGRVDWPNERILFDLAYEGASLLRDAIPPLYRNPDFNMCASMALTSDASECFARTEPHAQIGIGHIAGIALKNHHGDCIGYALVADPVRPENLDETVTLLQELGAIYGPYFEVNNAQQVAKKAVADAHTDVVTGMGNRRAFESFVQECLEDLEFENEDGGEFAMFDPKSMRNSIIMLVDFDGFKRVNDVLGHSEGDRALRLVSEALSQIGKDNRVYRLGGDELVQVFPRAGELDGEDLRQHVNIIERQMEAEGFDNLGLSIGVVHFFEGEGSLASLMALADARMYHDKRLRSVAFV